MTSLPLAIIAVTVVTMVVKKNKILVVSASAMPLTILESAFETIPVLIQLFAWSNELYFFIEYPKEGGSIFLKD